MSSPYSTKSNTVQMYLKSVSGLGYYSLLFPVADEGEEINGGHQAKHLVPCSITISWVDRERGRRGEV